MVKLESKEGQGVDFRNLLIELWESKRVTNPRYSLRAYAKFLDVEPSYLSKVLRQKRNLTSQNIERFGKKIGLALEEIEFFKNQLGKEEDANPEATPEDADSRVHFRKRSPEEFRFVASWYYLATLELMAIKDFKPNAEWLSKRLQITMPVAENCLEQLTKLGYIRKTKTGFSMKKINNSFLATSYTTEELMALQKQFLEKSQESIGKVPINLRDHSGITLSIDKSQIPEAKELIKKFRRKFTAAMQKSKKHDSVYQIAVSFFPLTDISGEDSI